VPERRFNEEEVAAILERAATRQEPGRQMVSAGEGLTLGQLQDIGREIGIAPAVIAEAADLLDEGELTATRRFLGLPMGVQRIVRLRRRLSQEEWERVVVELREIFDTRGVLKDEGSLRHWRNGNLQAFLEPTDKGQRIRLRTYKGNALALMAMGLALFGAAAVGITSAVQRGDTGTLTSLAVMAAAGAGMLTVTALRLIPWARKRREQMAEIAARVAAIESPSADVSRQ
jgi:hypothetical protein